MASLEDRLRAHLARVSESRSAIGIEDRLLRRITGQGTPPKQSWPPQVLAALAILALAVSAAIGLRLVRQSLPAQSKQIHASPVTSSTPIPNGSPTFRSVKVPSLTEAWALTDRGLLRTSDSWRHWLNVTPSGLLPSGMRADALEALSGTTAWITQFQPQSSVISIFGTQDGGQTWRSASINGLSPQASSSKLDFIDPQHGWLFIFYAPAAGSEGGAIYRTSDGGAHWQKIEETVGINDKPGSLGFGCDKRGVAFINATTGWATGDCAGGGPFFAVTQDGGRTWNTQELPGTQGVGYGGGTSTSLPVFFSRQAGYLVMFDGGVTVFTTSDGGTTWGRRTIPGLASVPSPIVVFQTLANGWAFPQDGSVVYRTTDGGLHWTSSRPHPLLAGLYQVAFVDPGHGFAVINSVSDQTTLLETNDGGGSWQQLSPTGAH